MRDVRSGRRQTIYKASCMHQFGTHCRDYIFLVCEYRFLILEQFEVLPCLHLRPNSRNNSAKMILLLLPPSCNMSFPGRVLMVSGKVARSQRPKLSPSTWATHRMSRVGILELQCGEKRNNPLTYLPCFLQLKVCHELSLRYTQPKRPMISVHKHSNPLVHLRHLLSNLMFFRGVCSR